MFKFKRTTSNQNYLIPCFFLVLILFSSQTVSAQLVPGLHKMHTSVDEQTSVYFVGNISLNGSFQSVLLNTSLDTFTQYSDIFQHSQYFNDLNHFFTWEKLYGFPVFSNTTLSRVNAYVVNTSVLSTLNFDTLEDLHDVEELVLNKYSNVSVKVTNGIALVGSNKQQYTASKNKSYGIGGIVQLSFSDDFPSTNIGIISDDESIITTQTNTSLLYPFESEIEIIDDNQLITRVSNPETIVLLQTEHEMKLYQQSILHFFPLLTNQSASASASISIVEKKSSEDELVSLIRNLNSKLSTMGESSISDVFSFDENLNIIAPLVSQILNSGIIILNSSKKITIDDTVFLNPDLIVGHSPAIMVTLDQQSDSPIEIKGNSSLVFVNNHLYSTNAESSDNGIIFPVWSFLFWLGAVASVLFYFLAKKYDSIHQTFAESTLFTKKWEKLLLILSLFIICFLIVDFSVSLRFGLSFLTILGMNVDAMITSLFFIGQLLLLAIIFILYALPVQLIHDILCKTAIHNRYQRLTKIIIALPFFWIGIQLYLLVLFNIVLSFLPLNSVIPMG